jgi:hypothetical protein
MLSSPRRQILHLMALQMAATVYIANAPEPRVVLRNFVEVLEDEVVGGRGDAAKTAEVNQVDRAARANAFASLSA